MVWSLGSTTANELAEDFCPRLVGNKPIRLVNRWAMRCRRPFKPLLAVSLAGAVSVTSPRRVSSVDWLADVAKTSWLLATVTDRLFAIVFCPNEVGIRSYAHLTNPRKNPMTDPLLSLVTAVVVVVPIGSPPALSFIR